jgi:hypothetical protein
MGRIRDRELGRVMTHLFAGTVVTVIGGTGCVLTFFFDDYTPIQLGPIPFFLCVGVVIAGLIIAGLPGVWILGTSTFVLAVLLICVGLDQ